MTKYRPKTVKRHRYHPRSWIDSIAELIAIGREKAKARKVRGTR